MYIYKKYSTTNCYINEVKWVDRYDAREVNQTRDLLKYWYQDLMFVLLFNAEI